ncbi:hypothetical protein [Halobiforma nitratireducens]|uniref:Uncharacterized protein n=1 Tax=Halobiforma nitratireducens JCM 10879 TaxID=1227454 RepID=M0MIP9_9EURY|nr:hypothetical protein [Halobiforma nitratireducens]EMA45238.1 hypothetical protein C446_02492 [Halobiforma nitratireducens JCM 10879]
MTSETTPDPSRRQYSRRDALRYGAIAVGTVTGGASFATGTAVADDNPQGVLADGFDGDRDRIAFLRGFTNTYSGGYGAPDALESLVDDARNEFNANTELWIDYGNWLIDTHEEVVPLGSGTVAVEFDLTRGRWPLRNPDPIATTIDAEYDDESDEFTALEWRVDKPDDPDFEVRLENRAAENAADELQSYRRDFIAEDDEDHAVPDSEYLSALAGEYAAGIMLGNETRSVLEVLLGEVDL